MHLILLGQEAGFWLFNNHSHNCQIFKNQTFLQKYCKGFLNTSKPSIKTEMYYDYCIKSRTLDEEGISQFSLFWKTNLCIVFLRPIKAIFKEFQDCEPLCIHNYHKFVLRLNVMSWYFCQLSKLYIKKKILKKSPLSMTKSPVYCITWHTHLQTNGHRSHWQRWSSGNYEYSGWREETVATPQSFELDSEYPRSPRSVSGTELASYCGPQC